MLFEGLSLASKRLQGEDQVKGLETESLRSGSIIGSRRKNWCVKEGEKRGEKRNDKKGRGEVVVEGGGRGRSDRYGQQVRGFRQNVPKKVARQGGKKRGKGNRKKLRN